MTDVPRLIVDMHTHLFNARYVPLKEILVSRGVPNALAGLVSRLILAMTAKSTPEQLAFSLTRHEEAVDEFVGQISQIAVAQLEDIVGTQLRLHAPDTDAGMTAAGHLEDSDLYEVMVDINREFGDEHSTRELGLDAFRATSGLDDFGLTSLFGGVKVMLERLLRKVASFIEEAGDTLDFLYTMMRGERQLLARLSRYYEQHSENFLFVHHMMDMAYPFEGTVDYDYYDKQLPRMTALERHSSGVAIGFSAFDPWRFVRRGHDDTSIRRHMDEAIAFGKLGFKFYPPLGYRAAGNTDHPGLERVINVFFDYCLERRWPIFTHCTPEGFELVQGKTGENAHPKYWEHALTLSAARNELILCFGHAGGGRREGGGQSVAGWLATTEEQWEHPDNYPRWVVDLCRRFPHVYAEIAYLHEIIHNDTDKMAFRARLVEEYARPPSSDHPYPLSAKLMYGSDWHMPSMVNDVNEYFSDLLEIFEHPDLGAHREPFFAANALRFFDLQSFIPRAREQLNDICASELERKLALLAL